MARSVVRLCFLIMAAGTSGSAAAQDGLPGVAPCPCSYERIAFEAADTNDDNLVSEAEFGRDAAAGFSTLDKDGSLTLRPEELGPHDPARFSRIDTNGDGVLTFSEVMANKIRALEEGDKNKDDGLSFEEMVQSVEADEGIGQ
ncbi:MAG TPA: hypothetical protein VHL31_08715 [Geminicoccus sp.]|uniref:hypothetical protein n=1 Tax=Geminicoccus sp. TaxID=2024832 RepID=UPI002E308256|nr:hypothetical protein [Geminicoccus sp.]HEX2526370.1 hypothetical protein [Geminicoccus sp.]